MANAKPRILFLDIETKPAIVATFGIREQHIGHKQILKDGGTICVGVLWRGEKRAKVYSDWEHGHKPMLEAVHDMLHEADAVATYNGAAFDIPKLQGEFLLAGMTAAPPLTQIDIYKSVRRLGYISNKLDYIAPLLGIGSKVKHDGLDLWLRVMDNDPAAQAKMTRYCAGDVKLTQQVYEKVRGFIPDHPHLADTKHDFCGACGSSRLQARSFKRAASGAPRHPLSSAISANAVGHGRAAGGRRQHDRPLPGPSPARTGRQQAMGPRA